MLEKPEGPGKRGKTQIHVEDFGGGARGLKRKTGRHFAQDKKKERKNIEVSLADSVSSSLEKGAEQPKKIQYVAEEGQTGLTRLKGIKQQMAQASPLLEKRGWRTGLGDRGGGRQLLSRGRKKPMARRRSLRARKKKRTNDFQRSARAARDCVRGYSIRKQKISRGKIRRRSI